MNVLLHTCCSCCALGVVGILGSQGHKVSLFFYNPNIHPSTEYLERYYSVERFARDNKIDLFADDYEIESYFGAIGSNYSGRCPKCYQLRISRTAEFAGKRGFDAISTTLLTSIYQDHEFIAQLSNDICNIAGLKFIHFDNRSDFRSNQKKAEELEMYRQKYCGCIFSERERYQKKLNKIIPNESTK